MIFLTDYTHISHNKTKNIHYPESLNFSLIQKPFALKTNGLLLKDDHRIIPYEPQKLFISNEGTHSTDGSCI